MKTLFSAFAGATIVGIGGVAAPAYAQLTQSFDFLPPAPNPLETTEIDQTGTLPKFDTSLGALTSVTLTLGGENTTSYNILNSAQQEQTFQVIDTTQLFLTDDAGLNLVDPNTASLFDPIITFNSSTGPTTIAASATEGFGPFTDSDSTDYLFPGANGSLAFFEGGPGDTFTLAASTLSGFNLQGGGGNLTVQQETQARFFGSVTYTYTPEEQPPASAVPGPLPLLGAATAFGFSRKLRQRMKLA